MKADIPAQPPSGGAARQDPHRSLHSETGALPGEHPGRSEDPLIKVAGLAWLEFEKPDLEAAERFYTDFGFTVADRTPQTLLLRGRWAGPAGLVVRRGPHARFAGVAYRAAARDDLDRLARGTGATVSAHSGGHAVALRDPSGVPVRVVYGVPEYPALPERSPLALNFGPGPVRVNGTHRPVIGPTEIERMGHVVLGTTRIRARVMCTRPTSSPTSTRSPPAGSTCASAATATRGASAGTSRAARSSTTGATPTGSCSSTTPTATCSTPSSSLAGRRCRSAGCPSGGRKLPRSSPAPATRALRWRRSRRCGTRATRSISPPCAAW